MRSGLAVPNLTKVSNIQRVPSKALSWLNQLWIVWGHNLHITIMTFRDPKLTIKRKLYDLELIVRSAVLMIAINRWKGVIFFLICGGFALLGIATGHYLWKDPAGWEGQSVAMGKCTCCCQSTAPPIGQTKSYSWILHRRGYSKPKIITHAWWTIVFDLKPV